MPQVTPPVLPSKRQSPPSGAALQPAAPLVFVDLRRLEEERRKVEPTFWLFTAVPSFLTSLVIHLLLLIGLGVCVLASRFGAQVLSIEVVASDEPAEAEQLDASAIEIPLPDGAESESLHNLAFWDTAASEPGETIELAEMPASLDVAPAVRVAAAGGSGASFVGSHHGQGQATEDLRSRSRRRQQALSYGATPDSENAVDLALEWIVTHQRVDGSWCFAHREGEHRCPNCVCGDPASQKDALNGATSLGLLPLLGAGNTHLHGRYRKEAENGLRFLIYRQKPDGSLHEPGGNMYSHGLAALALCEAYAMTREDALQYPSSAISLDELRTAAQAAIDFIEYAQHSGGGWRYSPQQPGDTSVVGWQMMALKSGYLAGLDVDPQTIQKAVKFLDSVADDQIGSTYAYMGGARRRRPGTGPVGATTPIGLLCRMYTGWEHDRQGLVHGVRRITRSARPNQGLYFYYYATQVMHHYGGIPWEDWNGWMREHLVKTQSRTGAETGSWNFTGPHDNGRLYCTSLAVMTLEVYYRYSPIYGDEAIAAAQ